jgi:hypothetical protein
MAKKNSSKTATEKAIQSSEPRVLSYRGWKGVNYADSQLTWNPLETGKDMFRQTDLPANFLLVQNNLVTSPLLGIETRFDSIDIGDVPDERIFTGVSGVYKHWLFCVARETTDEGFVDNIYFRDLLSNDTHSWTIVSVKIGSDENPSGYSIDEIGFFEGNLVATARHENEGVLLLAKLYTEGDDTSIHIEGVDWNNPGQSISNTIVDTPKILDPAYAVSLEVVGMESDNEATDTAPVRIEVCFAYTNRLGSTLTNSDANPRDGLIATKYVELSPALWTTKRYVKISGEHLGLLPGTSASGVDIYARELENIDWVFVGHVDIVPGNWEDEDTHEKIGTKWEYNWYGNMSDISQWLNSQLMVPTENTTHGPDATHFECHDSRVYYWGMPTKPYRLWIGGNPGAEFSVARGLGGAWIDIEPGSGYDVKGTAKWKTASGANIVTIMCGNKNTTKVKRFNLVETNLSITNEVTYKSYMYEEVSNVVGCNSRWGYGVFADGLYSLSRYGLMLTTMAMEYNNQMRNQSVSEAIKPIFSERLGKRLRDGRLVYIDGIIYIALSEEQQHEDEPNSLDNVILCYDTGLQAWYTFTHDQVHGGARGDDPDLLHHILAIDSDEFIEGLGAITDTQVRLYPTTGIQQDTVPEFQVLLETGELMPKMPMQVFNYIQQLEFRFDYLIGDPYEPATILIEGVDYYGRQFTIEKRINIKSRGNHGLEGEQRNFVEWVRVEKLVESLRIRIKGKVRFRLTHINARLYTQSDRIATPYGFDASDKYYNRHRGETKIHHYINDYDNLRRALVT